MSRSRLSASAQNLEAMWGKPIPEPEDENPVRRWVKLIAERDLAKGIVLEGAREKLAREMGNQRKERRCQNWETT